MSQNFRQPGLKIDALGSECVCPAANNKPTAGDPVLVGAALGGVAENTVAAVTDNVAVHVAGVFNLVVQGKTNGAANSAVVKGDKVYIVAATAVLNKDTTGVFFGYALGAVAGGNLVTVIPVLLAQSV
jgi:hypothetical protein